MRRNQFMDCPATLNKSGRGEDGKYFSLWQPDVRLDQQYLWRCASNHSCMLLAPNHATVSLLTFSEHQCGSPACRE